MLEHDADDRVDRALEALVRVGVGVGLALVAVVAVGLAARIEGLSRATFTQVVLIGVLLWPVYRLAPWRPGVPDRVRGWLRSNRASVALAAGFALAGWLPVTPDPVASLLRLPYVRTGGFFFGAELFYRPHLGTGFGLFVRTVGQWYVSGFVAVVAGDLLVGIARWVRSSLPEFGT